MHHRSCHSRIAEQRGVALLISLIVLVGLSLAGIALVRSVDNTALIAGNLAFRTSATISGDRGIEAARQWLIDNEGGLNNDQAAQGYYATAMTALDITGNLTPGNTGDDVNWTGSGGIIQPLCMAADAAGNRPCYVIHRQCDNAGQATSTQCSTMLGVRGGSSKGGVVQMQTDQKSNPTQTSTMAYFRITVRIDGPRNTTSYVQAYVVI